MIDTRQLPPCSRRACSPYSPRQTIQNPKSSVPPHLAFAIAILCLLNSLPADPTTRPADDPFPAACINKAADTPHFYQRDPRWSLTQEGENYCVPTAVSDSLVYFAANGFDHLLPIDSRLLQLDSPSRELAQAELVKKLASTSYMDTDPAEGTVPSGALNGIHRYVQENGYTCARLEYAGWRRLDRQWRKNAIAPYPDLNWIKAAVAAPQGAAWLEIGFYKHATSPGVWQRIAGHTVAAVGYGTDGSNPNPYVFLVDNPAVGARLPPTPADRARGLTSRPITLADQAITLTPIGPTQVIPQNQTMPRTLPGMYQLSGPGVRVSKKYDAAFLDGAIVLYIRK